MESLRVRNGANPPGVTKGKHDSGVHGRWYADGCASALALELVGERWSLLVVREMLLGPRRFGELRAALPGLSAKTLTERLELLEERGIAERVLLARPVAAQAYGLTQWGRGLEPVLLALLQWASPSPLYNAALPLSPVAFLLRLRAALNASQIGDFSAWIGFDIAGQHFAGRLRGEDEQVAHSAPGLTIHPASEPLISPDLRFAADSAAQLLPLFFGIGEDSGAAIIDGNMDTAARFTALFGSAV